MVDVAHLPRQQRLILASLSGVAARYGVGGLRDRPRDEALAAVWQVTRDPFLLGIEAGTAAADPLRVSGPVAELLVAAGADVRVAAEHEGELRARYARTGIRYDDPPR
jgi:hypothetical protein